MDFSFLKSRKLITLLFGFFGAILGTALLPVSISNLKDAYRLEDSSATRNIPAKILLLHSSNGRSGVWYYIDYTYTIGNLSVHVRSHQISQENWQLLKEDNSLLTVKYLSDDPKVSEPVLPGEEGFEVTHSWIFVCSSFFLLVGGYWIALFSKRGRRAKKRRHQTDTLTVTTPHSPVARPGGRAIRHS